MRISDPIADGNTKTYETFGTARHSTATIARCVLTQTILGRWASFRATAGLVPVLCSPSCAALCILLSKCAGHEMAD